MARPGHNRSLHGSAPETSDTALLLVDLINDLAFKGGAQLSSESLAILPKLVALRARARANRVSGSLSACCCAE